MSIANLFVDNSYQLKCNDLVCKNLRFSGLNQSDISSYFYVEGVLVGAGAFAGNYDYRGIKINNKVTIFIRTVALAVAVNATFTLTAIDAGLRPPAPAGATSYINTLSNNVVNIGSTVVIDPNGVITIGSTRDAVPAVFPAVGNSGLASPINSFIQFSYYI